MEHTWKNMFLWSANPIPLEVRNMDNLLAVYKEGSNAFIQKSLDTCSRAILKNIYEGKLEDMEIAVDVWDIRIMGDLTCRLQALFPSLDITWVVAKKAFLIGFQGLRTEVLDSFKYVPEKIEH